MLRAYLVGLLSAIDIGGSLSDIRGLVKTGASFKDSTEALAADLRAIGSDLKWATDSYNYTHRELLARNQELVERMAELRLQVERAIESREQLLKGISKSEARMEWVLGSRQRRHQPPIKFGTPEWTRKS